MVTPAGGREMHEDKDSESQIYDEIDELVRARTSVPRVRPRGYPDPGNYIEQYTVYNFYNCPIPPSAYCRCSVGDDINDGQDKATGDHRLSASREEVVIGLQELREESTVEVGEHWEGFQCVIFLTSKKLN